jgi:hypothetical protein
VDTTLVNMEGGRAHCCWDGAGHGGDARVYRVLSGRAVKLSQGSPKPGEEGLIRFGLVWFQCGVFPIHHGSISIENANTKFGILSAGGSGHSAKRLLLALLLVYFMFRKRV